MEIGACGRNQGAHLEDAVKDSDVFLGLSVKGAMTQEMVKSMRKAPIIFAMANPDPEITPEDVKAVRARCHRRHGRSDYPNQVNNVLGFPYIFRGALDVRATHHQRRDEDRRRRTPSPNWRARMCPTKSPPPIAARARSMAPTTSFRCRSIRA